MPPRPPKWRMWTKIAIVGVAVSIGGPAFTMWLSPTPEELRAKYNPDLRKRSLEQGHEREQEFDDFVNRLKQYSKSDKSIWVAIKEEEEIRRVAGEKAIKRQQSEAEARRDEMRREAGLGSK